jgi:hypothetical protein
MNSKKKKPRLSPRSQPLPATDPYQQSQRHYSRQHTFTLWQQSRSGVELTGEEGRLVRAMREHPAYYDLWDNLDGLSDDEVEWDGVNPIMHVTFHAIIENQLAEDGPAQVNRTLQALLSQGHDRHEAIHGLASVFIDEFYKVMKEQRPFNEQLYVRKLKKLAGG